jgi:hypothetical protein
MGGEESLKRQEHLDREDNVDFHRGQLEGFSADTFFKEDETDAWKQGWKAGREAAKKIRILNWPRDPR